jgi:hypothetical protein
MKTFVVYVPLGLRNSSALQGSWSLEFTHSVLHQFMRADAQTRLLGPSGPVITGRY